MEDAFTVHLPGKKVKFQCSPSGLYYYKPPATFKQQLTQSAITMINTIVENAKFYTKRQRDNAKKACELYHALGTPSIDDFKVIIHMNLIKDNPVMLDDIKIAEAIYGPNIGSLKGKTTHRKPKPVIDDFIEIPSELYEKQKHIVLCIDAIKINGIPFLTTVSHNLLYRTCQWVQHQTSKQYESVLCDVFRTYNLAGFRIMSIHCDNEF